MLNTSKIGKYTIGKYKAYWWESGIFSDTRQIVKCQRGTRQSVKCPTKWEILDTLVNSIQEEKTKDWWTPDRQRETQPDSLFYWSIIGGL